MKKLTAICTSVVILILTSIACNAQEWSRKDRGELFVMGKQMAGDEYSFYQPVGFDTWTIGIDDTIAGGLGVGFNFHDYFNLNIDIFYGSTDLTKETWQGVATSTADLCGMNFNLDYNILKQRFTPVLSGGTGFIYFNGDVEGYALEEADFSYSVGAGFRWDIADHFLIKGIYKFTWIELDDADSSLMFEGVNLSIGYLF